MTNIIVNKETGIEQEIYQLPDMTDFIFLSLSDGREVIDYLLEQYEANNKATLADFYYANFLIDEWPTVTPLYGWYKEDLEEATIERIVFKNDEHHPPLFYMNIAQPHVLEE